VGIIPHTVKETTLRSPKTGFRVNLEADVLARYVQRALQIQEDRDDPQGSGAGGGLTEALLREQGFV
jgi:riboflavin synthase